jgi:hypothetical protein
LNEQLIQFLFVNHRGPFLQRKITVEELDAVPEMVDSVPKPEGMSRTPAPGLCLTAADAALGNTDCARISCGFNHLNR